MKTNIKIILIILSLTLTKTTFAYNYGGKEFKINISENIQYIEYCYYSGQCKITNRQKKIVKINEILIRKHLKPLY